MFGRFITVVALCGLGLGGCADSPYNDEEFSSGYGPDYTVIEQERGVEFAETQDGYLYFANTPPKAYTLDSGDKIRIDVFGQENLSRVYSVDGGGFISMPLIGSVKVRGVTTYALGRIIARELSQEYVRDPNVTVEINTYRPFFILGEIQSPGKFPYENGMTVQTAVAIAGGYSPRASERYATVTRMVDGRQVTLEVPMSFRVAPGDTIRIEERFL